MFEKVKELFAGRAEAAQEMRSHPGPADLAAIPPHTARVGGLGAVPIDVVGAYVGLEVEAVRPLDPLGPESSGLIANAMRTRLREGGVGDESLEPGELVAGQNAARLERMRAQGMSEEQIAMIQAKILEQVTEHQKNGWTIEFTNGNRASVMVFDAGSPDGGFDGLKAEFDYQHTKAGAHYEQNTPTALPVHRIDGTPYEIYYLPGRLSAQGRTHSADATASHLGTMQLDRTLAALAVLALHSLDG